MIFRRIHCGVARRRAVILAHRCWPQVYDGSASGAGLAVTNFHYSVAARSVAMLFLRCLLRMRSTVSGCPSDRIVNP